MTLRRTVFFLLLLASSVQAQYYAYPPAASLSTAPPVPASPPVRKDDKKTRFAEWLLPFIIQENQRVMEQRQTAWRLISYLNAGYRLDADSALWLERLAREYRVQDDPLTDPKARNELLLRVDAIPPSLALAQAAIESAWGQSRFTRVANNLFGIWTWDERKGVLPKARKTGKKHYVRKFPDAGASLRYYMHLLNTLPAYRAFRELRHQQRLRGEALSGPLLAEGLDRYSARGKDYVLLIRNTIRSNGWTRWDYF